MSGTLRTWAKDRAALLAEYGAALRGDPIGRDMQVRTWLNVWAADVRAIADRRETVPPVIARSYLRTFGPAASRDLRAAANADEVFGIAQRLGAEAQR